MQDAQSRRTPFIWPALLVVVGVLLLLNNYLLIDLEVVDFWPLVLIFLGLQLLWRGDLALSWQAQTFGITRGSVQSGVLEISSGEIDVRLRALQRPGRLIAGQYTARSRPGLVVRNNRAALTMKRGQTWLFSMADWEVALAKDLPWRLMVSAYLGQLDIDMRGLKIDHAYVASGIADVRVVCPADPNSVVFARSTLGDVRLIVPERVPAVIQVKAGPLCRVLQHSPQFEELADRRIVTRSYIEGQPAVTITVSSTFGNIHLLSVTPAAQPAPEVEAA